MLARVFAPEDRCWWASGDASQAFSTVLLPMWMWFLQGCPPVKARDVPPEFRQPDWDPEELITPFYKRLAMGGIHSVWILMVILVVIIKRCLKTHPELRTFTVLNLRSVRLGGVAMRASEGVKTTLPWPVMCTKG